MWIYSYFFRIHLIMNQIAEDENGYMTFYFYANGSNDDKLPKTCEVSKITPMKKIKHSYAKATKVCPELLHFTYYSDHLDDKDTPDILGMRNCDVISVHFSRGNVQVDENRGFHVNVLDFMVQ